MMHFTDQKQIMKQLHGNWSHITLLAHCLIRLPDESAVEVRANMFNCGITELITIGVGPSHKHDRPFIANYTFLLFDVSNCTDLNLFNAKVKNLINNLPKEMGDIDELNYVTINSSSQQLTSGII